MKQILIICMSIVISGQVFAQSKSNFDLPLYLSYYGDNLIHPGFKLGTVYTLSSKTKSKTRKCKRRQAKLGNKVKFKSYQGIANMGFYSHPNNDYGLSLNIGIGYERIKARKGNLLGFSLETGYLRNFNQFKTYQLDESGQIETVFLAGQNNMLLSFSASFGRDLSIKRQLPVKWFVKPSAQLVKYNHGWFPNGALELGIIMNLKKQDNDTK